jgi:hypothetical protein
LIDRPASDFVREFFRDAESVFEDLPEDDG